MTKVNIPSASLPLTPTPVKTNNYNASAGDFVPVDTTSGNISIALHDAPPDKTRIGIKHITQGTTGGVPNTVTIACGGTDVFNKAGGPTILTLSLLNQGLMVQYQASGGIWLVQTDDLALGSLDDRYQVVRPITNYGAVGDCQIVYDGAMAYESAVLVCATSNLFTSSSVGKTFFVYGAASGGLVNPCLTGTIASYQSPSQVTLSVACGNTSGVSAATMVWGTDNRQAFTAAVAAVSSGGGGDLLVNPGNYLLTPSANRAPAGEGLFGANIYYFAMATGVRLLGTGSASHIVTPYAVNGSTVIWANEGMTDWAVKDIWWDTAENPGGPECNHGCIDVGATKRWRVSGCKFTGWRGPVVIGCGNGWGSTLSPVNVSNWCEDITICDNSFYLCSNVYIQVVGSQRFVIGRNTVFETGVLSESLGATGQSRNGIVTGNNINGTLFIEDGCQDISVSGNQIVMAPGTLGQGLRVDVSANIVVQANIIDCSLCTSPDALPLTINNVSSVVVQGNIITRNSVASSQPGITASGAMTGTQILDNIVQGGINTTGAWPDILHGGSVVNCAIRGNQCLSDTGAIVLESAVNATILNNVTSGGNIILFGGSGGSSAVSIAGNNLTVDPTIVGALVGGPSIPVLIHNNIVGPITITNNMITLLSAGQAMQWIQGCSPYVAFNTITVPGSSTPIFGGAADSTVAYLIYNYLISSCPPGFGVNWHVVGMP